MDIDDDAPVAPIDSATRYQHTLLYVVQRCWHSGPKLHVPVDMLRLFHTQREAEEAAYHSALAFHEIHAKPGYSASVKTLMLPSYPSHNPQGSSYGFLACGGLFWVRALQATVVTAGSGGDGASSANNSDSMCHSAAYAILTEGVIGGTGNRNSRRGTEVCDGRVFGGDAAAAIIANEAVARVRHNLTNPSLLVEARTVPVGKPPEWLSAGGFVTDWPVQAGFQENNKSNNNNYTNDGRIQTGIPFGTTPKRQIETAPGNYATWGRVVPQVSVDEDFSTAGKESNSINSNSNSNNSVEPTSTIIGGNGFGNGESFLVIDCPFELPDAKRRRVVSVTDDYAMMQ